MSEFVIAMVILGILLAISIPYVFSYRKLYRSEDQSLKVLDLMRETGQLALTRRRNFRFEIDLTANAVLIIDENNALPDRLVKSCYYDGMESDVAQQVMRGIEQLRKE